MTFSIDIALDYLEAPLITYLECGYVNAEAKVKQWLLTVFNAIIANDKLCKAFNRSKIVAESQVTESR